MGVSSTKSYTQEHIQSVRRLLNKFADALKYKGEVHDQSKLEEPEVYGWAAMDLEEKYDYGSPEYYDKIRRYSEVFKHHYMVNSHHPEHFKNPEYEMTLVDMIEMLCDWFSYKDDMTLNEAINLINDQCKRFKFSKTIKSLLINTYRDSTASHLPIPDHFLYTNLHFLCFQRRHLMRLLNLEYFSLYYIVINEFDYTFIPFNPLSNIS